MGSYYDVYKLCLESGASKREALWLIEFSSGLTRAAVVRDFNCEVPDIVYSNLLANIDRFKDGEPPAYITGECEFYGNHFIVTPDVLIPRIESERLVKAAIDFIGPKRGLAVLDLCCGSGCLGLSVINSSVESCLTAIDVSEPALKIAAKNADRLSLRHRAEFIKMNILDSCLYDKKYDIIISNPPYVTTEEMTFLDQSVKQYEPHLALHGGTDGLDFYRTIAANWKNVLKDGGLMILECAFAQADSVQKLTSEIGRTVIIPTGSPKET